MNLVAQPEMLGFCGHVEQTEQISVVSNTPTKMTLKMHSLHSELMGSVERHSINIFGLRSGHRICFWIKVITKYLLRGEKKGHNMLFVIFCHLYTVKTTS